MRNPIPTDFDVLLAKVNRNIDALRNRLLSAAGDLITFDGVNGEPFTLPVGDDGEVLIADSSQPSGLTWGVAGGGLTHNPVTLDTSLAANLLGLNVQQLTLDTQAANLVFAGPASGAAAAPTFRALVDADIPAGIARDTELHAAVTLGAGSDPILTLSGQQLTLGNVATQAELDAHEADTGAHHPLVTFGADTTPLFSIGSGQIINFDNQNANTVLAGPASGAAADPTMRALVEADLPATVVLSSRSVLAGNGLTGGGALTANVTLTLGTPSGLTVATTNAVTTTSHTHAISSSSAITSATAVIMATDANGRHRLMGLGIGAAATGNGYLTLGGTATINSSGAALTIAPAAGQHLLVNLATTGDFKVNTDDLVVDTSSGNVSMAGSLSIGGSLTFSSGSFNYIYANAGLLVVQDNTQIVGSLVVSSNITASTDVRYSGNLVSRKGAPVDYIVYGAVPVVPALTSTNWNSTAKTAANNGTIDLHTEFSVPDQVTMVLVELRISSSAAAGRYAAVGPNSSDPYTCVAKNISTTITGHATCWVPCVGGDVYFVTNGGDVTMKIHGYCI